MNAPPEYYFAFNKQPNGDIKMFVTVTKDRDVYKFSLVMDAAEANMYANEHDLACVMMERATMEIRDRLTKRATSEPSPAKP